MTPFRPHGICYTKDALYQASTAKALRAVRLIRQPLLKLLKTRLKNLRADLQPLG
jgi:hypothetical protein